MYSGLSIRFENERLKGKNEKAIEMAKEMILDKESISKIIKYTKLTEKEIKDIEKTL